MSEPIPLGAALGIEDKHVVIDRSRGLVLDRMLKGRPSETGSGHAVESPIGGHAHAFHDLAGSGGGVLRREEIEHPQLILISKEAPGVASGAILA